jgi:hypothetical protein
MSDLTASRTLVKSPPELWSELSEVEALAGHLGELGEIKITRVEPEHTVAWEGERAKGTVSLEPSGWGTTVTFTAEVPDAENPRIREAGTPSGLFNRLFPGFWVQEPETELPPVTAPSADPDQVREVLDGALDALGSAHHRPFSRG